MTHAEIILRTLDRQLEEPVHLILYGRAALSLGFPSPPPQAELSMDVDVILPMGQADTLEADESFWRALNAANQELESRELYLTHLFDESQVILRPTWLDHLVPILDPSFLKLKLSRPSAIDLLLTKMMRGPDPEDMADAAFLIRAGHLDALSVRAAIESARIPDVPEIRGAFAAAQPSVLRLAEMNQIAE